MGYAGTLYCEVIYGKILNIVISFDRTIKFIFIQN
jgi:hypothetical protein